MGATIRIKFTSGKEIELSNEEMDELRNFIYVDMRISRMRAELKKLIERMGE